MQTPQKRKVEAIYPLTYLQEALLFHSISAEEDQGIIQFAGELSGRLDRNLFQRAWQQIVAYQPAMRTSVHWENMDKPVSVVRPTAKITIEEHSLESLPPEAQEKAMADFKAGDARHKIDLTKASCNRLAFFYLDEQRTRVLWTSHHILLDGWSAGVILKNVFRIYDALVNDQEVVLPVLPSYKQYLAKTKQLDAAATQGFWADQLRDFTQPTRVAPPGSTVEAGTTIVNLSTSIGAEDTAALNNFLRAERVALNAVIQASWAVVLAHFTSNEDVLFGTTIAGRRTDIPNHQEVAGLYANTLPVRVNFASGTRFTEVVKARQLINLDLLKYGHASLEEINQWSDQAIHQLQFDHLVLVQNQPWEDLSGGGVSMADFTGDITSTHPLTVMITPSGGALLLQLRYAVDFVPSQVAEWLLSGLNQILLGAALQVDRTIADWWSALPSAPALAVTKTPATPAVDAAAFSVPANATELELLKIWETLLGVSPISTTDDFFQLGGTSLLAVRLFSRIEEHFGKRLRVASILEHRSIRALASMLTEDEAVAPWETLVPLRANGDKPPLFCFHAGLGHVLFYQELCSALPEDQPVYAVQPSGLQDASELADSIRQMAEQYLDEILRLQPQGPYYLLSYCFSNPVCLEIAHIMIERGLAPPHLMVVDSGPSPKQLALTEEKVKPAASWLRWIAVRVYQGKLSLILERLSKEWLPPSLSKAEADERNLYLVKSKLELLYTQYVWKPLGQPIHLIRSTSFANRENKNWHIDSWNYISGNQLMTTIIEGTHPKLFEKPFVLSLAGEVQKILATEH
ncbi:MAG: condensation domain-containing protein [Bacteroidota bacterium]